MFYFVESFNLLLFSDIVVVASIVVPILSCVLFVDTDTTDTDAVPYSKLTSRKLTDVHVSMPVAWS